jgi:DNA-binding response OmpR family regulator
VAGRILLVEDDTIIGASLSRALGGTGYDVEWARDATSARAAAASAAPDLVLLDLGLPDGDGIDVCRQLVAQSPGLPVIMLTARQEEVDLVIGLGAGAVDYVTKPFRLAELLARVAAHLRFAQGRASRLVAGDIVVDLAAHRAWVGARELDLRAKEFDLLARLAADAGKMVTREALMADVWDEHWVGSTKTLDVQLAALRRKLGEAPGTPSRITSIRSLGFRLEAP